MAERRAVSLMLHRELSRSLPQNMLTTAHSLIEGYETVGDWTAGGGATLAADSTYFKEGTKGVKMTTASGVAGTMVKTVNLDLSTQAAFQFWFYIVDVTKVTSLQLYFSNNAGVTQYYQKTITTSGGLINGWNRINLVKSDFGASGSPSWSSPFIRLQMKVTPVASQVAVVTFDGLIGGVKATPTCVLAFDDENDNIYTYAPNILRPRKVPATVYTITDLVGTVNKMTLANLTTLYGYGWDIANHTKDHSNLSGMAEAAQETELSAAKTALEGWGFTRASKHVAYPSGASDANTITAMTNTGMLTGRSTNTYKTIALPWGNNFQVPILTSLSSTITLAQTEALVDTAVTQGAMFIVLLHGLVESTPGSLQWTTADYAALVDYMLTAKVQFATISEAYRLMSSSVLVHHK